MHGSGHSGRQQCCECISETINLKQAKKETYDTMDKGKVKGDVDLIVTPT